MSVKRSRPGHHEVKHGKNVGPDYPADRFRNPVNAEISTYAGSTTDKTMYSPSSTIDGVPEKLNKDAYDKLWEGK